MIAGVNTLISLPLLTLTEIVLLVPGKELKMLMIAPVRNQYDELSNPNKTFVDQLCRPCRHISYKLSVLMLSHVLGILTVIGGSTPHTAPIVLPIVVTGFLVNWIYNAYKQSYVFFCYAVLKC
jgi:hypothetical protein